MSSTQIFDRNSYQLSKLTRGSEKFTLGNIFSACRSTQAGVARLPSLMLVIEKTLKTKTGSNHVGHPISC